MNWIGLTSVARSHAALSHRFSKIISRFAVKYFKYANYPDLILYHFTIYPPKIILVEIKYPIYQSGVRLFHQSHGFQKLSGFQVMGPDVISITTRSRSDVVHLLTESLTPH